MDILLRFFTSHAHLGMFSICSDAHQASSEKGSTLKGSLLSGAKSFL